MKTYIPYRRVINPVSQTSFLHKYYSEILNYTYMFKYFSYETLNFDY